MSSEQEHKDKLVAKYAEGKASEKELQAFFALLGKDELQEHLAHHMDGEIQRIRETLTVKRERRLWPRIAVAAAAVVGITLGVWLYYPSSIDGSSSRGIEGSLAYATDIAPGRNTATLTLADGKLVELGGQELKVSAETGLSFQPVAGKSPLGSVKEPSILGSVQNLVVSTPRGGTYQVVLPDGSKVWLNADSKISFPSKFVGASRRISLVGEAYFEIAKLNRSSLRGKRSGEAISSGNQHIPFIVQSRGQQVEVLGTHFNINSYEDEGSTKTTLLEGAVRVSSRTGPGTPDQRSAQHLLGSIKEPSTADSQEVVLKPGQQSVLSGHNRIKINQANLAEAVAWKNGMFSFNNASIQSVMRQIARWYDVEVSYESEELKNQLLDGSVSRYDNVSGILNAISQTGAAKFKIEGRRIIVTK